VNDYIKLLIWIVVVGAAFAFLWRKGYLKRLANYVQETQQELKKCTWPNRQELTGSTAVVIVAFSLMAIFTVVTDVVVSFVVRQLL
jgi:preprotein translocase SecE subunit